MRTFRTARWTAALRAGALAGLLGALGGSLALAQTVSILPGAGPADGNPTWPRDTTGAAAAQLSILGNSGTATLISTRDALPVANFGPTASSSDPAQWGNYWNASALPGILTGAGKGAPVWVSPFALYTFAQTDPAGTQGFDVFFSRNAGQTNTLVARVTTSVNFTGGGWTLKNRPGEFLVGGSTTAVTPTGTGLVRWLGTATAASVPLPGLPNGLTGRVLTLGMQSQGAGAAQATVLALYVTGANAVYVCRSADTGATFTCGGTAVATAAAVRSGQLLASPEPGVWLLATSTGLLRNATDGAGAWVSVLAGGSYTGVVCVSSTVCLALRDALTVVRSVDGGRTFTTGTTLAQGSVPSVPPTAALGFADLGNGIVATLPNASGKQRSRSEDYGFSWTAVIDPDTTLAIDPNGAVSTLPGYAAYTQLLSTNTSKVTVSNPFSSVTSSLPTSLVPLAVAPGQRGTLLNSANVSAANTALAISLTGAASESVHLYGLTAFCSAGTATLNYDIGGPTLWSTSTAQIGTSTFAVAWTTGYTFAVGFSPTVRLTSCGIGNTGTLYIHADRY
jgi:hypothetical protein